VTILDSRPAGATLPADIVTWLEDGVNINPANYVWSLKAYRKSDLTTILFTKSSGITATSTTTTIAWTPTDLGALTADVYILKLIGTSGSLQRIHELQLTLDA
jgi:hypothetical protein